MSIEPRALIGPYMPGNMPPPPAHQTVPWSREQSHTDRLNRWDRTSITELRAEHRMLCRLPGMAFVRSVLERVLVRRLREAQKHGSAAE